MHMHALFRLKVTGYEKLKLIYHRRTFRPIALLVPIA